MNKEQSEKLEDYLDGLTQMRAQKFVLGSVRISENDFATAKDALSARGITLLAQTVSADESLNALSQELQKKRAVAIKITRDIPSKLVNQLNNIGRGVFNAQLAGNNEPTILNPIPTGALLVLVFTDSEPDEFGIQQILTSMARV